MAAAKKAHATVVVNDPDTGSYLVIQAGEEIPERVLDQITNPVVLGEKDAEPSIAERHARLLTPPAEESEEKPAKAPAEESEAPAEESEEKPAKAPAKGSDKK